MLGDHFLFSLCRGRLQRKGKVCVLDLQRKQAAVGQTATVSERSRRCKAALPGDIPVGHIAARTVHVSHIQPARASDTHYYPKPPPHPFVVSSGDSTIAMQSRSLCCLPGAIR